MTQTGDCHPGRFQSLINSLHQVINFIKTNKLLKNSPGAVKTEFTWFVRCHRGDQVTCLWLPPGKRFRFALK